MSGDDRWYRLSGNSELRLHLDTGDSIQIVIAWQAGMSDEGEHAIAAVVRAHLGDKEMFTLEIPRVLKGGTVLTGGTIAEGVGERGMSNAMNEISRELKALGELLGGLQSFQVNPKVH